MTQVRDIMSPVAFSCRADDSLNRAAQIMWEHDCGCVPVVDGLDRAIGIITDRDVCMAAYTQGKALSEIPVSSAYSRDLKTCSVDDPIDKAEKIMIDTQVRRLPVVEADGHVIGLLSLSDLARHVQLVSSPKSNGMNASALSLVLESVSRARRAMQRTAAKTKGPKSITV